jgi:predicted nucleic acid-binding protein
MGGCHRPGEAGAQRGGLQKLLTRRVLSPRYALTKTRPAGAVLRWLDRQPEIAISAVTLEELTFGVERARGSARDRLRAWLQALVDSSPRVVPVTALVATKAAASPW